MIINFFTRIAICKVIFKSELQFFIAVQLLLVGLDTVCHLLPTRRSSSSSDSMIYFYPVCVSCAHSVLQCYSISNIMGFLSGHQISHEIAWDSKAYRRVSHSTWSVNTQQENHMHVAFCLFHLMTLCQM